MLAEEQSLGTDLRYSSVCLITPILRDHFRFVGNPSLIPITEGLPVREQSLTRRGGPFIVTYVKLESGFKLYSGCSTTSQVSAPARP